MSTRGYHNDDDGERFSTGEDDLDGEPIEVTNSAGFGACDVQITGGIMTWEQFDLLKQAMELAEKKWR